MSLGLKMVIEKSLYWLNIEKTEVKMKEGKIEIYFSDLIQEKQEEFLSAYGIANPKEMNWDIVPMVVMNIERE